MGTSSESGIALITRLIHTHGAKRFSNTTDAVLCIGEPVCHQYRCAQTDCILLPAALFPQYNNSLQVLDVFIVLDESGSVGETNYHTAIDFVRKFIEDLDKSVRPRFMNTVQKCCDNSEFE